MFLVESVFFGDFAHSSRHIVAQFFVFGGVEFGLLVIIEKLARPFECARGYFNRTFRFPLLDGIIVE